MNDFFYGVALSIAVCGAVYLYAEVSFDTKIVQLNPSGRCIAVFPEGDCGMLPDKYSVEHVGYGYQKNEVLF